MRANALLLILLLAVQCSARLKDFRARSKNVTNTLDNLLSSKLYDKRLRPDLGGPPTVVTVSVYIKSMGAVSETDQRYSMDTYFRQSWFDPRLRFSLPGMTEFSMSWIFLDRVWKPDTFFLNGHKSHLHRITVPNKFLRVRSDGFMTYSMRLTLQAKCPMFLRKFPMDSQNCPLLIGSYGYKSNDVTYAWHPTLGMGLEPGLELAQYQLVNVSTTPNQYILRNNEEYSMISATFHLRRNTGYYTLQVFIPCGLIVCCSWVSFWIDPDAVPARVSLGVTTVLSMTTMGISGRANMPRVNYATAMDWFVILCFAFVFAVMLEYAAINFIDKVTGDIRRILEDKKKKKKETAGENKKETQTSQTASRAPSDSGGSSQEAKGDSDKQKDESVLKDALRIVVKTVRRLSRAHPSSVEDSKQDDNEEIYSEPNLPPPIVITPDLENEQPGPSQPHNSNEEEIEYADGQSSKATRPSSGQGAAGESGEILVTIEPDTTAASDLLNISETEPGGIRRRTSFRRCLSAPYRLWEQTKLLPSEADVQRLMQSTEPPDKFSRIDIISRKVFPIAFGFCVTVYWFMYGYYITDMLPEDEKREVLFEKSLRQHTNS